MTKMINETLVDYVYNNGNGINPFEVSAETTQELITKYCSSMNTQLFWLLGIVLVMWLIEPKIRMLAKKYESKDPTWSNLFNENSIMFVYKNIGLGLIILTGYMIWIMA